MAPVDRPRRGLFVTLEGLDGVGKTTQLELLAAWLSGLGHDLLITQEPAGTPLGETVDRLVKTAGAAAPTPRAEALLFLAARAQHVEEVLRPALAAGRTVLCSRFSHSTLAYQCGGLGLDEPAVRAADAFARDGLRPDVVLLFDLPRDQAAARVSAADRIEARDGGFHERVRAAFLRLAEEDAGVRLVSAAGGPERVHQAVREALAPWL
ncbi:MAG: dTMP kinase [Armatimonadetes bacterium]|nr:dTMP kinase [Armatimonadota bacterium]